MATRRHREAVAASDDAENAYFRSRNHFILVTICSLIIDGSIWYLVGVGAPLLSVAALTILLAGYFFYRMREKSKDFDAALEEKYDSINLLEEITEQEPGEDQEK